MAYVILAGRRQVERVEGRELRFIGGAFMSDIFFFLGLLDWGWSPRAHVFCEKFPSSCPMCCAGGWCIMGLFLKLTNVLRGCSPSSDAAN